MSEKRGTITDDILDCMFQNAEITKTIGRVSLGCDISLSMWLIGVVFYRNMIVLNIGPVALWAHVSRDY